MSEIMMAAQEQTMKSGYFNKGAFTQKEKTLILLKTGIAGVYHNFDVHSEEFEQLLESLPVGTKLKLYRDVDNEHDRWAVSVFTEDDVKLGYLSRFKNETVARLLDYGKNIYAEVTERPERPKTATEHRRTVAPTEGFEIYILVYMTEG